MQPMTDQRVEEALAHHAAQIRMWALVASEQPENARVKLGRNQEASTPAERLGHLLWMCEEARTFLPEKVDKAMRWLGFIQGALWVLEVSTIEESKRANMPEGEEFKP